MSDTALTTTMSVGGINFATYQIPESLPVPRPRSRSAEHYMREGQQGPGIRVIQMLGAHPSYDDISMTVYAVSNSQVTSLDNLFRSQNPFIWSVTFGIVTKQYRVVFQDDGFEPIIPDLAAYDGNTYQVNLGFRVLENL